MQFVIEIPDDAVDVIAEAFAQQYSYVADFTDPEDPSKRVPNPESKLDFARRQCVEHVREVAARYRIWEAHQNMPEPQSVPDIS